MPATIQCPHCGTVFQASCGSSTICRNPECKAQISVDGQGNIRSSKPNKKK